MSNNDYIDIAITKTISFLKEQGLKYRKLDFSTDCKRDEMNYVSKVHGGIVVALFFAYGERGSKLKKISDRFLNYVNARVLDSSVRFSFTYKELDLEGIKHVDSTDKLDKVMAKISKLLALSSSPVEAEAISASMKAQELLAKYNLDIEMVTGEPVKEKIDQCIADVGTGNKWKYHLAESLARSYCCRVYYKGSENIIFYGREVDILIARRVFIYLFGVGNRLARAYTKEQRELYGEAKGVYNSFCMGFVKGVDEQLSKHCKALALVTPREVNESFDAFSSAFKNMNCNIDLTDHEAYAEGKIEGKRALNAQYIEGGE